MVEAIFGISMGIAISVVLMSLIIWGFYVPSYLRRIAAALERRNKDG